MVVACEKAGVPVPASLSAAQEQLAAHQEAIKAETSSAKKQAPKVRKHWLSDMWGDSIGRIFAWARGHTQASLSAVLGSDGIWTADPKNCLLYTSDAADE